MTHPLRILAGSAALAVAFWCLTPAPAPAANDVPDLPAGSVKKAADADLKFLQTRVADLAKKQAAGAKVLDGYIKPATGVSLLLAAYADILGDAALKADVIKVAEALDKKDFAAADGLAKKLAIKPGTGKPGALPTPFKGDKMLEYVMQPFRPAASGGANIDKDIKEWGKAGAMGKLDLAAVEVLAIRTAVINAYGLQHPNGTATVNAGNKKLWDKWSTEAIDQSKKIATEAAKGAKADEKSIRTMLGVLVRSCNDCHEKFRDN